VQPLQKRECLAGLVLGEQHAGQQKILGLAVAGRLVASAEAAFLRPAGSSGHVALNQQQPCPLHRDGVEEAGVLAKRDPPGFAYGVQGPGRIPLGMPDPG